MSNNLIVSMYLYELYKSKYLEENKDKEMDQDEINSNMDKYRLLYLFNTDLPKGDYLDKLKKYGTEIKVNGYSYNLNKIAVIVSGLSKIKTEPEDLAIINNEVFENKKSLTLFNRNDMKNYKLNIDNKNTHIIIPKKFSSYGVNMLCMDEAEHLVIEDDYLMNITWEILNKNGGYITDRSKLNMFSRYIDKKFMRKWDKENMMVSVILEDYYETDCYYDDCSEFLDEDDF